MYPLKFRGKISTSFEEKQWNLALKEVIRVGIPPEFGGESGVISPEELFLGSIINCYVGTFKVVCKNSNLFFETLSIDGTLIMDKNEKGKPWMKQVILDVYVSDFSDKDRLESISKVTQNNCFVHNSVKSEIIVNLHHL